MRLASRCWRRVLSRHCPSYTVLVTRITVGCRGHLLSHVRLLQATLATAPVVRLAYRLRLRKTIELKLRPALMSLLAL